MVHSLCYELVSPCCLVHSVDLQPFCALFMHGAPTFAPRALRVRVVRTQPSKDVPWPTVHWQSPVFPVALSDRLQSFRLERPVLVVEAYIQVLPVLP